MCILKSKATYRAVKTVVYPPTFNMMSGIEFGGGFSSVFMPLSVD